MTTFHRLIHWESGDLTLTDTVNNSSGSISAQSTTKNSGAYALQHTNAASDNVHYLLIDSGNGLPTAFENSHHGLIATIRFAGVSPSTNVSILQVRPSTGVTLELMLRTDGKLELWDDTGTAIATAGTAFSTNTWYQIRVYFNRTNTNAAYAYDIRSSSGLLAEGDGVHAGGIGTSDPDRIRITGSSNLNQNVFYDYIAYWSGLNATTGSNVAQMPASEVMLEKWAFRGDGTSSTSGDALDVGSWANTQEVPFNQANDAEYTANPASGYMVTDGTGGNDGPEGSSNIDGDGNIVACQWGFDLNRDGGGSTTHGMIWGNDNGGGTAETTTTTISVPTGGIVGYVQTYFGDTNHPSSADHLIGGMDVSGNQDLHLYDWIGVVLHEPPVSYSALSSANFPVGQSQIGPFET